MRDQLTQGISFAWTRYFLAADRRSQLEISWQLARAGHESYAVRAMALCLDLRLLLLPRKGE
jgi:hypothetical protein